MGQQQCERTASPRPQVAADLKNEDIDATATPKEEPRLPDVPGWKDRRGWMLEDHQ